MRATRRPYHDLLREESVAGVEGILGREVTAFLSDSHLDPDVPVEVWLLQPGH